MGKEGNEVGELGRQADQDDIGHDKETGFQTHQLGAFLNEFVALNSDSQISRRSFMSFLL